MKTSSPASGSSPACSIESFGASACSNRWGRRCRRHNRCHLRPQPPRRMFRRLTRPQCSRRRRPQLLQRQRSRVRHIRRQRSRALQRKRRRQHQHPRQLRCLPNRRDLPRNLRPPLLRRQVTPTITVNQASCSQANPFLQLRNISHHLLHQRLRPTSVRRELLYSRDSACWRFHRPACSPARRSPT